MRRSRTSGRDSMELKFRARKLEQDLLLIAQDERTPVSDRETVWNRSARFDTTPATLHRPSHPHRHHRLVHYHHDDATRRRTRSEIPTKNDGFIVRMLKFNNSLDPLQSGDIGWITCQASSPPLTHSCCLHPTLHRVRTLHACSL